MRRRQNVNRAALRPRRTERRKNIERLYAVLGKKRRQHNPPSAIQEAINEMIKQKLETTEQIVSYFNGKNKNISQEQARLYKSIIDSRVKNLPVKFSDLLANKECNFYFLVENVRSTMFTNDFLWLNYVYRYYMARADNDVFEQGLSKISSLNEITICSETKTLENVDFKRGYIQDFEENFFSYGIPTLPQQFDDLYGDIRGDEYVFQINDVDYVGTHVENDFGKCIVYKEREFDQNALRDLNSRQKKMSVDVNGKIDLTWHTLGRKSENVFLNCKVKPEKFCPAFLELNSEFRVDVLFRCGINYNGLFKLINDTLYRDRALRFPPNLIYWDTIKEGFDFLGIFAATSSFIDNNQRGTIADILYKYNNLKDILKEWKENQLRFQAILQEFYLSFSIKIGFDKLLKIYEKIKSYIEVRDALTSDESYPEVLELINLCQNELDCCRYIHAQMTTKTCSVVANGLSKILFDLTVNKNANRLVDRLKNIGKIIFDMTLGNGDPMIQIMFPIILSPSAFLGNVLLDTDDNPVEYIERILNQVEQRDNARNNARIENMIDVFRALPALRQGVIKRSIDNYISTANANDLLARNTRPYDALVFALSDVNFLSRNNILDWLNERIIEKKQRGEDINQFSFTHDAIRVPVMEMIDRIRQENEQRQDEIDRQRRNIREAQNNINRLENRIPVRQPPARRQEEEEYFEINTNIPEQRNVENREFRPLRERVTERAGERENININRYNLRDANARRSSQAQIFRDMNDLGSLINTTRRRTKTPRRENKKEEEEEEDVKQEEKSDFGGGQRRIFGVMRDMNRPIFGPGGKIAEIVPERPKLTQINPKSTILNTEEEDKKDDQVIKELVSGLHGETQEYNPVVEIGESPGGQQTEMRTPIYPEPNVHEKFNIQDKEKQYLKQKRNIDLGEIKYPEFPKFEQEKKEENIQQQDVTQHEEYKPPPITFTVQQQYQQQQPMIQPQPMVNPPIRPMINIPPPTQLPPQQTQKQENPFKKALAGMPIYDKPEYKPAEDLLFPNVIKDMSVLGETTGKFRIGDVKEETSEPEGDKSKSIIGKQQNERKKRVQDRLMKVRLSPLYNPDMDLDVNSLETDMLTGLTGADLLEKLKQGMLKDPSYGFRFGSLGKVIADYNRLKAVANVKTGNDLQDNKNRDELIRFAYGPVRWLFNLLYLTDLYNVSPKDVKFLVTSGLDLDKFLIQGVQQATGKKARNVPDPRIVELAISRYYYPSYLKVFSEGFKQDDETKPKPQSDFKDERVLDRNFIALLDRYIKARNSDITEGEPMMPSQFAELEKKK